MIVRPETWINIARPGLRVEMSMVQRKDHGGLLHCPGCAKLILTYAKDSWIEW
jgi:hypothetical protein